MTDKPEIIIDLLEQQERWVDARGEEHAISAMPEKYVRRVVAYLENCADEIVFAQGVKESLKMDHADLPPGVLDDWVDTHQARAEDPVTWLRTTPLFVRFREELARTEAGAPW